MAAAVRIVLGEGHDRLAERYRATEGIAAAMWVAPTERRRDELLRGLGVQLAPQIVTFPELARLIAAPLPASRVLPASHQQILMDRLLADLAGRKKLAYFGEAVHHRGVADAMFSLVSELKGLGVSAEEFDGFVEETGARPNCRDVALVYRGFEKILANDRLIDREAIYAKALERLQAGPPARWPNLRRVFVDGFSHFTPPQRMLLAALSSYLEELWITLPADSRDDDARGELYSVPSQTEAELQNLFPEAESIQEEETLSRPAGLQHLADHLFGPEAIKPRDAAGLRRIEAPGLVGEVRHACRAIKELLLSGVAAGDVLVSANDLSIYADLLIENFAEYGLPLDMDHARPLSRNPFVATLLAAAGLKEADWPFAGTAALLRSTLFRPDWPEAEKCAEAELLLRSLGEPRGRDHYLRAARSWAEAPEVPLEDEEAEGATRRRKHLAAKACLPFLERFFTAWDTAPGQAIFVDHAAWLREFAVDVGLCKDDGAANLEPLWHELERWAQREAQLYKTPPKYRATDFFQLAGSLAASAAEPREPAGPGRVRAVPAALAAELTYRHLFLLGLGERGFPSPGGAGPLLDEAERQAFRGVGLDIRLAADQLPEQMLLYYRLVTRAACSVTLAYPAVDEKGQELLPGTFLRMTLSLFEPGAIPVEQRRMLVAGLETQRPLCPAEYRVRHAIAGGDGSALGDGVAEQLSNARRLITHRFERDGFTSYDGLLGDRGVLADLKVRMGPDKVFTPTSLEDYIACPYKFYLKNVLRLEPLDDPGEEVEHASRGATYHRALARLHRRGTLDDVTGTLAGEIDEAVAEYADRASSPATKMLWQLEGERLKRSSRRYEAQWDKFRSACNQHGVDPAPTHIEADFSGPGRALALEVDGVRLRLGGRIDRIDAATREDGTQAFWVIDYKTGAGFAAAGIQSLAKLQLAIYALVGERLLDGARPAGLAYWMVTENGPKVFPKKPTEWLDDAAAWPAYRGRLGRWLEALVRNIRAGRFPISPRDDNSCIYCDYGRACRISQSRRLSKEWDLPLPDGAAVGGDE